MESFGAFTGPDFASSDVRLLRLCALFLTATFVVSLLMATMVAGANASAEIVALADG